MLQTTRSDTFPGEELISPDPNRRWNNANVFFHRAADISNIGVKVQMLQHLCPSFFVYFSLQSVAPVIAIWADTAIYAFKSAQRLSIIAGRECFGVEFKGQEVRDFKHHLKFDVAMLSLAVSAATCFALATPWLAVIGWVLGILATSIQIYTDYHKPTEAAWAVLQEAKADPEATLYQLTRLGQDYRYKRGARNALVLTLFCVGAVMITGKLAILYPTVVAISLVGQVASVMLACLVVYRVLNEVYNHFRQKEIDVLPGSPRSALGMEGMFGSRTSLTPVPASSGRTVSAPGNGDDEGAALLNTPLTKVKVS